MAELADALDLGSSSREWGFDSLYPHQTRIKRTLIKSQSSFFLFQHADGISLAVLIFTKNYFVLKIKLK